MKDRIMKILFIPSAKYDSDILMKNLSRELYEKYSRKILHDEPS